jgi:hypothetical protein
MQHLLGERMLESLIYIRLNPGLKLLLLRAIAGGNLQCLRKIRADGLVKKRLIRNQVYQGQANAPPTKIPPVVRPRQR